MPFDASSPQDAFVFTSYICTDDGAALAQDCAAQFGQPDAQLHGGGLSGAARVCQDMSSPHIILAELGNTSIDMACECVAEVAHTGATLVIVGAPTDIDTYRTLRRAGAAEYYSFPARAADIAAVKRVTPAVELPQSMTKIAPSVAVMGATGGVGASLLAQNLAFHIANPKGLNMRTALLDADIFFGTQAVDLDRDSTPGLLDALTAPDRIDPTFTSATMEALTDRLSLYSHQLRIGLDPAPYLAGMPQVFAPLRADFDAVITDLPRTMVMQNDAVLSDTSCLVLLVPAGFAGVNAASRLIARLTAEAPDLRILPVLSELRRDAGLSKKDIVTTLGRPVVAVLPRCDAPIARTQRAARPLIQTQPRGAYAKAVRKIWTTIDTADAPAPRSLRKRILG